MNPAVFIPCGEPGRDGANRGHTGTVPCAAARANHNSHRERNGAKASSAICHGPVFSVKRTVRAIIENVVAPGSVPDANTIKAVRIPNSRQPFGAGNRIPGSLPAVHLLQEHFRGEAPIFQRSILSAGPSGLVAVFDLHECSEWEIPNDGKTEARPGNLTARDGKYAC